MQLTVYYNRDDEWLIEKLKAYAYAERKSVSAVVLTALQAYFETGKPLEEGKTLPSPPPSSPAPAAGTESKPRKRGKKKGA